MQDQQERAQFFVTFLTRRSGLAAAGTAARLTVVGVCKCMFSRYTKPENIDPAWSSAK